MKRIIAVILVALSVFALTACGKFTCDLCGEEKSGSKHKTEIFGQEIVICDDCYEQLEALGNLF